MQSQPIFALERFQQESNAPLYQRIKKLVLEAILGEELRQGDSVPSEREVAELLRVSRVTVRKAFSELVSEGVLVQKRGSGTYVNSGVQAIEQPLSRLTSFSEDMRLRGFTTEADWLMRDVGLAIPEEALKLSLSPGEPVARLRRLRRANAVPMAIEYAVVPLKFLGDINRVENSLYAALQTQGNHPVRALQRLKASSISGHDARLLGLDDGFAVLSIERISYLGDGRPVEHTRSLYRGDAYDFVAELNLVPEVGR